MQGIFAPLSQKSDCNHCSLYTNHHPLPLGQDARSPSEKKKLIKVSDVTLNDKLFLKNQEII